jgi:PKD repeat protein
MVAETYTSFEPSSLLPDFSNVTYKWEFGDGTTGTGRSVNHNYRLPGSYTVSIVVNNDAKSKKSKVVEIAASGAFKWTGTPLPGYTFSFVPQFTQLPGAAYHWNFGDGSTSSDAAPTHSFDDTGYHWVSLTINNDTTGTRKEIIRIIKDPLYTAGAAGMKVWHRSIYRQYLSNYSTYAEVDTSAAIAYINPITLSINSRSFQYNPDISGSDTLYYGTAEEGLWYKHSNGYVVFKFTILNTFPEYTGAGHHPFEYFYHTWKTF